LVFRIELGLRTLPDGSVCNHRESARAVIAENGRILLLRTRKGDYKFPGGAIKPGESREEALLREVAEETGYTDIEVMEELGSTAQIRRDLYEKEKYFRIESSFYLCRLLSKKNQGQSLDPNEIRQGLKLEFVTIGEAIRANERALADGSEQPYDWVPRETAALREIAKCPL